MSYDDEAKDMSFYLKKIISNTLLEEVATRLPVYTFNVGLIFCKQPYGHCAHTKPSEKQTHTHHNYSSSTFLSSAQSHRLSLSHL